jgi:hypothetical protein
MYCRSDFKEKDLYEAIISYQKENDLEKQANKLKNKYVLNNYLKAILNLLTYGTAPNYKPKIKCL